MDHQPLGPITRQLERSIRSASSASTSERSRPTPCPHPSLRQSLPTGKGSTGSGALRLHRPPTSETTPSAVLRQVEREGRGAGKRTGCWWRGGCRWVNSGYRANSVSAAPHSEHTGGRCRCTGGRCVLWFHRGSNRLGRHTTMGRKGETTKFKGAKPAPSEAAKKERERKKKRDREDDWIQALVSRFLKLLPSVRG